MNQRFIYVMHLLWSLWCCVIQGCDGNSKNWAREDAGISHSCGGKNEEAWLQDIQWYVGTDSDGIWLLSSLNCLMLYRFCRFYDVLWNHWWMVDIEVMFALCAHEWPRIFQLPRTCHYQFRCMLWWSGSVEIKAWMSAGIFLWEGETF